ncbi:nitrogen regulation protein NR(II) [Thiohalobacter sp. IOR34]|uniref:nitrogen regulation protein NR(II) n=1 Tax=Thiohalobacter sp. IOR34 TaxID=3057176 RepID=UPI0025B1ED8B|nr:nitrogen regulation protein NR(II) [Thiohalobacter sp. IOR34]WJW75525.1 nitrogen regulation protein NR(II) [Thiohalobacter sp. IOR34]
MPVKSKRPLSPEMRILESLNTAVLVFDQGLAVRYLNPAGEMLFETSARHARGIPLEELVSNPEQLSERLQGALRENRTYTDRELPLKLQNGKEVIVDCTVTPQLEPGQPTEVLVEMNRVDRHLRISREEGLIEQNTAMRQLVRGLAHEIKNPLGGLRGAAQLLERELANEEQKEYTQIIIGEADRLRNLVNRMLGPNNLPQKRPCNIHQVLEHVGSLVEAENEGRLKLSRDYDPSIPDFSADPEMLIQSVLNIVRNAVQALQGKGEVRLRTRTQRQFTIGQKRHRLVVRVDVIDHGPGIPPELQETIFMPMVSSHAEGSGLGLPIAQSLVNLHGGLIECSSRAGETVFTILLPLEPINE